MAAVAAAALVLDDSCAAGAALVDIVAAAAESECRRRVSDALSILAADSKSVMSSKNSRWCRHL